MGVTWTNVTELRAMIDAAKGQAVFDLAQGLYQEAETIMTRSKRDFVPVKDGTLRGSGFVDVPVIKGTAASVTMGYGGAASAYALIQHEALHFRHPNGGQAKYLEQPVMEATRGMDRRLGATVGEVFRT